MGQVLSFAFDRRRHWRACLCVDEEAAAARDCLNKQSSETTLIASRARLIEAGPERSPDVFATG